MSGHEELQIREDIVEAHRQLYRLGFSVANDGNTSFRLGPNRILITPKGLDKASLSPKDLALVDENGKRIIDEGGHPSSEIFMHLGIYQTRSDINAIVHAHPPFSIACSLAGISLSEPLLPEVILTLKEIPLVPYCPPGSGEIAEAAAKKMRNFDAIILERHGAVCVGSNVKDALSKMERMEHTAKIVSIAKSLGKTTPLSESELHQLRESI